MIFSVLCTSTPYTIFEPEYLCFVLKILLNHEGLMFENFIVFSLAKLSKSVSRLTKCLSANSFGMVRVMATSNLLSLILKLNRQCITLIGFLK